MGSPLAGGFFVWQGRDMQEKDQIKEQVDIVELLQEYLETKPSGSGSFKALCPFHGEKTPSFHISSEKQIWHCFGCGEGGDCFAFIMKMEGMDFPEALRHLGKRVGIEVKQRFNKTESNEAERMRTMNALAQKYYRKVLIDSPSAASARAYLESRGIPFDLAEKFGLGFAPDAWDNLAQFFQKRGFAESEGLKAGLLLRRKKGTGMIDRFRNRLMVPLRDQHGNTVGFTGRSMPGDEYGPKYMNSPETPIYHKGGLLYGLDLAKRAMKTEGAAVIVEGNLDVIASHKAGIEHVVASSGTALTETQLSLLKRFTDTIIFSFDQDAAGFEAAKKGIAIARSLGLDVRIAVLPEEAGKDPDEAIQKDPEHWRRAVSQPIPIMKYYIDRAVKGRDLSNVDDKRAISRFLLPELSMIQDVVEREHWLQVISDLLRTDAVLLRKSLAPTVQEVKHPQESVKTAQKPVKLSKTERAAELILAIFLQEPAIRKHVSKEVPEGFFTQVEQKMLYKEALEVYTNTQASSGQQTFYNQLRHHLEAHAENILPHFNQLALRGEQWLADMPVNKVQVQIEQLILLVKREGLSERRRALQAQIRQAEMSGDHETVQVLIREFNTLR